MRQSVFAKRVDQQRTVVFVTNERGTKAEKIRERERERVMDEAETTDIGTLDDEILDLIFDECDVLTFPVLFCVGRRWLRVAQGRRARRDIVLSGLFPDHRDVLREQYRRMWRWQRTDRYEYGRKRLLMLFASDRDEIRPGWCPRHRCKKSRCDSDYVRALLHADRDVLAVWAHDVAGLSLPYRGACTAAARRDDAPMVRWLARHGCRYGPDAYYAAAESGHVGLFQEMASASHTSVALRDAVCGAAMAGNIALLRWLDERGGAAFYENAMPLAAGRGHDDAFRWIYEGRLRVGKPIYFYTAYDEACMTGDVRMLDVIHSLHQQHVREHGVHDQFLDMATFQRGAVRVAMNEGHASVIEWIHAHDPDLGHWDPVASAYTMGDVRMVKWLRDRGCNGRDGHNCVMAAQSGCIEALEWAAVEEGMPLSWWACAVAVNSGHLHVLAWLRDRDCPWGRRVLRDAIAIRRVDIVDWALSNGCPMDDPRVLCMHAASSGSIKMLRYLHFERGFAWDESACSAASGSNRLAVLQWLRRHGCPWDENTCMRAAHSHSAEVLWWARENGCPWNWSECERVAAEAHDMHSGRRTRASRRIESRAMLEWVRACKPTEA